MIRNRLQLKPVFGLRVINSAIVVESSLVVIKLTLVKLTKILFPNRANSGELSAIVIDFLQTFPSKYRVAVLNGYIILP